MKTRSCATCEALHYGPAPSGNGALGYQCRRHPPHVVLMPKGIDLAGNMQMSLDAIWPVVNPDNVKENWFCCDWLAAEPGKFIGRPDLGLDS